jgi:peptidoglycan/LPS O-acetylase OafA/YrhL
VLAAYLLVPALNEKSTAPLWRFLSFTQNIGLHYGETFTHSWSLCIEEQFYVVLPIAVLLIAGLTRSVRAGWAAMILAVLAGITVRGVAWWAHGQNHMNPLDYSEHIYYSSFGRADELLFGVAIATLKNFHGEFYQRLLRHGNLLLAVGVLTVTVVCALFLNYMRIDGYGYTFAVSTFGYSALAASFAILTLAALSPNSWLSRIRIPGAEKLALWSYAIYLAHKPVFKLLRTSMEPWHIDINAPLGIAIIMFAGMFAGWLLYLLVESPFMALRQRWFPSNRAVNHIKASAQPSYP